jgi:hypothetical protein
METLAIYACHPSYLFRAATMSALGQKRTFRRVCLISAIPPKADIGTQPRNVRFVPKADICGAAKFQLFDHLVGAGEHLRWDGDTKRLGGPEVND